MRILFLTHYFHPEVGAAQTRIFNQAASLAERGHEVTVLTGFPNYPDGVVPEPYRGHVLYEERIGGVRVLRTPIYPAPNRGFGRRLLNHLSFALSAPLSSGRAGRADVAVVETPPLFAAASGVAVARLARARMVLHVADMWPDVAIDFGALENPAAIRGARAIESFVYRHADHLVATTPGHCRALREKGVDAERLSLVPHGVDLALFPDHERPPVEGRVVYCGTIGMGHSVGTLVDAAALLRRRSPRFHLLIAGDGPERSEHERRIREMGIDEQVTFLGRVERGRLAQLLTTAQVTVVTQRSAPLLRDALSSKVLEYMAAGRPVVAAVNGWTGQVVRDAGAGVVTPPQDAGALADAVGALIADPDRARELGRRGRRHVEEHLSRQVVSRRLEQALETAMSCAGAGKRRPVPA